MTALSFADASFLKLTTLFGMDAVTFEIDPESSDFQLLEMLLRSDEYDSRAVLARQQCGPQL